MSKKLSYEQVKEYIESFGYILSCARLNKNGINGNRTRCGEINGEKDEENATE